jgi:hypothetical protein
MREFKVGAATPPRVAVSRLFDRPERRLLSTRFSGKIIDLMPSVAHRCALTDEDRDTVFRCRYEAYRRQNIIDEWAEQRLFDEKYDDSPNAFLTMTSIKGEFAGTFRIHVAKAIDDSLPSRAVFADVIDPFLRERLTVVDPTRLAARLEASRGYPQLPFLALRPAWLAAAHFNADIVLATVAGEHVSFYQRVFGYEALSDPRDYPLVHFKIVCLGLDFRAARDSVEGRYPFFRSTSAEREALFGRYCVSHVAGSNTGARVHGVEGPRLSNERGRAAGLTPRPASVRTR